MTSGAANMAVRERRHQSGPTDLEQVNIMKALTAAEHSRRQFVLLNYAASKDTSLLTPGKKSEVVKLAEQWVVGWLHQNNLNPISSEYFKYTVDTHLWATYIGNAVEFPFTFMRSRSTVDDTTAATSPVSQRRESDTAQVRPLSEVDPLDQTAVQTNKENTTQSGDELPSSTVPSSQPTTVDTRQSAPTTTGQWSSLSSTIKRQSQPTVTELPWTGLGDDESKRRSLSLSSIDEFKMSKSGSSSLQKVSRLRSTSTPGTTPSSNACAFVPVPISSRRCTSLASRS
ncbi:hypothetical protein QBC36DRAFT_224243 [Triangularia setosa]|uniref:Uncharacterized protein n=1 Tax=Triangularia setosa TaxID=2587417 RepID=A0AAN7A456_9PEZI|nr:hypothetical protein QBC36DRAFT_224243 [Podospora setosa]